MISKELLSQVLDKKVVVDDISNIELKENTITFIEDYWDEDEGSGFYRSHTINIYELAHKCKEWAVNLSPNKHALSSYPRWGDIRNYKKTNGSYYICQHLVSGVQFEAETEPEAIFKACEWVLEQVGKK